MVAGLMNVDRDLASRVAQGLGIDLPDPLPRVLAKPAAPRGDEFGGAVAFRAARGWLDSYTRGGFLVADGVDVDRLQSIYDALTGREQ